MRSFSLALRVMVAAALAPSGVGADPVVVTADGQRLPVAIKAVEDGVLVAADEAERRLPFADIDRIELRPLPKPAPRKPAAAEGEDAAPSRSAGGGAVAEVVRGVAQLLGGGRRARRPPKAEEAEAAQPAVEPPKPVRTVPSAWRVQGAGGLVLTAGVAACSEETLELRIGKERRTPLHVPLAHVREVWGGSPDEVAAAKALEVEKGEADDVAYVAQDESVHAVAGRVKGLADNRLVFQYGGEDRKIALEKLVGVVVAPRGPAAGLDGLRQDCLFVSGDALPGTWAAVREKAFAFAAPWGERVEVPEEEIAQIAVRNGRVAYLSDLEPVSVEETPYFDRVMRHRRDRSLAGDTLRLKDGEHDRGLATHARCRLEYDLGGRFETFRARVGFQQPDGRNGRAAIRVLADGQALHEQVDARGDADPVDLALQVAGAKRLTLEVDFGEREDVGDQVVWAGARLIAAQGAGNVKK